jgi:hypothetical protein
MGVGRARVTMVSLMEGTPTRLPGSPASVYPRRAFRAAPFVTKTSCTRAQSSRDRDVLAAIVIAMDVVAIVLGIAMFAILMLMIEGIDRV